MPRTRPQKKRPTYLIVPAILHQIQVHRNPRGSKFLAQSLGLTARIARHIGRLLDVRQRDQFRVRVRMEHGLEAFESGVDCAAEGRRGHQLDCGVVREVVAQLLALFVAEVCEEGVWNDVVGC